MRRPWLVAASAALALSLLSGCVSPAGSAPSDPRSGGGLAYGLAPRPDQGVSFQPDVVLVDGGASAVRSVSADGLTWTLSPQAGGIGDLALNRVMFLTDRGVGRVKAIKTTDAGVEVTVGPVDVTEVIADGRFASTTPVAIEQPVAISGAGAFWADPELQAQAGVVQTDAADLPEEASPPTGSPPTASPPTGAPPGVPGGSAPAEIPRPAAPPATLSDTQQEQVGAFDVTETCCDLGPGTDLGYDKGGLTMDGSLSVDMAQPSADFVLDISDGKVKEAGLSVHGLASITAKLTAVAQPNSGTHGFSPPLGMDLSFDVPIGTFFGVPLNMVVTQRVSVEVNIPGQAKLDAVGKITLGSTLGFAYRNGTFSNTSSASLDSSASLSGTNSIAVGISYASFSYNVRFTVGLGLLGFTAGVFLALGAHLLAAVGAPIGFNPSPDADSPIEQCRSIQGDLWLDYGVGYTIPTPVAKVINFFLSAFRADPVPTSGGISNGWTPILSKYEAYPSSGFCVQK